MNKQRIHWVP